MLEQRRLTVLQECPAPAGKSQAWNRAIDSLVCGERLYDGRATSSSAAEVEKLLAPAVQEGTVIGPALALRGLLALEKGRLTKAAQDADQAIRLTPKEARGFYVRGRVRFERNDPDALSDLVQAAQLSRRVDPAILHWLAAAQFRAGKTDQAIATQQEAIKLNGADPELKEQLREFQKSMNAVKKGE
jgi:predicted Zn-dependent protease